MARLARWRALDDIDLEAVRKDPTLSIKMGLRDPVRPFVKGEMHPSRKVATPRLIMAISIVDQLVERYIFADFSNNEKSQYPYGANMVGFGRSLAHDLAITQKVRAISAKHSIGPTASDVSGWERRVSPKDLESIPEVVAAAMEPSPDSDDWKHLAKTWAVLNGHVVYVIGRYLYVSTNPGMMPSGTYMTSFGNGIMRIVYALAAGALDVVVLGDDCLEWLLDPAHTQKTYNEWGLVTREVTTFPSHGKQFSFCSKYYDSENEDLPLVVPQSWAKILASFANQKARTPAHFVALSQELNGLPRPLYIEIMQWASRCPIVLPLGVEQNASAEEAESNAA